MHQRWIDPVNISSLRARATRVRASGVFIRIFTLVVTLAVTPSGAAAWTTEPNAVFRQGSEKPAEAPQAEAPAAEESQERAEMASMGEWLVLPPVDRRGRRPIRTDSVWAQHGLGEVVTGPTEGEEVTGELGEPQVWRKAEAAPEGWVAAADGSRLGVAHTTIESPSARIVLARLRSASTMTVGSRAYAGDVYDLGFRGFPVRLAKGTNHVFVSGIRGRFALTLEEPEDSVIFGDWDVTQPDLLRDKLSVVFAGMPLLNMTQDSQEVKLFVGDLDGGLVDRQFAGRWILQPGHSTQVAFGIAPRGNEPQLFTDLEELPVRLELENPDGEVIARGLITLRCRSERESHMRTMVSRIDNSVQKFAVVPHTNELIEKPGLIVSLHGASVEAWNQASSYEAQPDLIIVAPTNRRPFGFDWQDWGRLNVNETVFPLLGTFKIDRSRVYLTGHSMGGHGTWHVGGVDSDFYAAIAPSAGWRGFDDYGGRPDGELAELWRSADRASEIDSLLPNLSRLPAYILHGEDDDNVPVEEARAMIAHYEGFAEKYGTDFDYHIEPKAGHWWDGEAPGADCVAYPELLAFLRKHVSNLEPTSLRFTTPHPSIEAYHHWFRLDQPERYGETSTIEATYDAEQELVHVELENVRRFTIMRPASLAEVYSFADGTVLAAPGETNSKTFVRGNTGQFELSDIEQRREKRHDRAGPIKFGWGRKFIAVLPTAGTAAENEEARDRFYYDAAVWRYRGNGVLTPVTDSQLLDMKGRRGQMFNNVVLYGNSKSNRAWRQVVPPGPFKVDRGSVTIGKETFKGDDLAISFVHRRHDADAGLVLVNGSTGPKGDRLAPVIQHFVSGAGFPDYILMSSEVLTKGDGGVLSAGWLDHQWIPQDR